MVDKLIDFILNQIKNIIPFTIILQFNNGVKYRFGKYVRTLTPGIYFKFPYLETILQENSVDTTILLPALSIDNLVLRASIGYKIRDMGKYYNNVYDTKSAISDLGCVVLRLACIVNDKSVINDVDFGGYLCKLLQKEVNPYGIKIKFFELIEFSESRSYKLFNENVRLES